MDHGTTCWRHEQARVVAERRGGSRRAVHTAWHRSEIREGWRRRMTACPGLGVRPTDGRVGPACCVEKMVSERERECWCQCHSVSLWSGPVYANRTFCFFGCAKEQKRVARRCADRGYRGYRGYWGSLPAKHTDRGSKMEINTLAAEAESRSVALSRAQSS